MSRKDIYTIRFNNTKQMRKIILTLIILSFSISLLQSQVRIKMKNENGVYTTPCIVNGLRLRFIFDTGASNVSISLTEATFMLKNGYLDKADLHGSSYSQIANGDIVENTTVILKELEIGGIMLYNIEAIIIHELSAPLLLGQSAIQKLGKIQLENDELVIINTESSSGAQTKALSLIKEAEESYFNELYNLSANTYQKAYDLSPESLTCWDLYIMGSCYEFIHNYSSAIKFLGEASGCMTDQKKLYYIYVGIGNSYQEKGNSNLAAVNIEKAISYGTDDKKSSCYADLGAISFSKEKYNQAIDYYKRSIEYYLNYTISSQVDVKSVDFKDDFLAGIFWNMSKTYLELNREEKGKQYLLMSASFGYEQAIEMCIKYGFDYKSTRKKKRK